MASHSQLGQPLVVARRKGLAMLAATSALMLAGLPAWADKFPSKPSKITVGSPPGALGDVLSRLVAERLRASTGQTVIVDNRPGAGGNLAADSVAKAPGDGYTMLVAPDSVMVVNPFIYTKLPYDPQKDFQSVSLIGKASLVLIVSPSLGVKTAQQFIDLAKSQPGKINFGSGGNGHPSHLAMELFADRTGVKMSHVPYKGTSPALQGLMGGETAAMMVGLAEAMPQIKAGRVVAIATSGPTAKGLLPQLPQLQQFHKDLDMTAWFGLWVPASTPKEVVQELNGIVTKLLQQAEFRDRLVDFGMVPTPSTSSELDDLIKRDQARFGPLVRQLELKVD